MTASDSIEASTPGSANDAWGFNATPAQTLSIWEQNAEKWPFARSPWRPSAGDLEVYRRLVCSRTHGRVLVLGTTPELRDLLAGFGVAPVLVEKSRAMHTATSALLRLAEPARETWIEADWCEAGFRPGSYDLVLGDMVWWVVSVAKQACLRETLYSALKPDGLLIGRIRLAVPERRDEDPLPVAHRLLGRLDKAGEDAARVEGELLSFVYDHTADHQHRRLDRDAARTLLLTLAKHPSLSRQSSLLEGVSTRLVGADWTCQSRSELLAILKERFAVLQEVRADDYESAQYPIFVLGKNDRRPVS